MLKWLRQCRFVPPMTSTTPRTPLDVLMERYHDWLVEDRGLAVPTVRRYEAVARRVLQERRTVAGRSTGVEGLSGTDVTDFLLEGCSRLAVVGQAPGERSRSCFDSCSWRG
jgi:hypothetical protein